jgi:hypothetical protein
MKRVLAVLLGLPLPVVAQQVGAESGVYAEAYDITGRAARRPAQSMRVYASPSFSWMGFEIGTMLVWSTDDQFTAQTSNRFYLNPRWRWGQVHAGDYTPIVSRYTATAVRVRGGGIELTPGRFRFSATGGLAQDASDLSAFDAAPRRFLYSGLVGYGDPGRTFIELSALRAIDDSAGADSLSVSPQENVVAALAAGLAVGRLHVKGDVAASLFSRDIRASELDSLSQPGFSEGIFTPRLSSRVDHSWSTEARVVLPLGAIGVQLEEVGPGFTTLGNPYLPNDKREARLFGTYRLARGRVVGSASLGTRRDNLAGDKRGTTNRRTGAFAITVLSGRWLVSSLSVLANGLTRTPDPLPPGSPTPGIVDSFELRNVSRSIAVVEQARFGSAAVPQSLTLTLSSQQVDDASPRFGAALDATSTSVSADWSLTFGRQVTVSIRPGQERFRGADRDESFASFGVGVARRAAKSRWHASLLATYTQVQQGSQWRGDVSGGVRLGSRQQLALLVRHTRLAGVSQPFTETLANLRLTRRF